jgi:hypothetical protein
MKKIILFSMFLLIASNALASSSNFDSLCIPANAVSFKITNYTEDLIEIGYTLQFNYCATLSDTITLEPNQTKSLKGIKLINLAPLNQANLHYNALTNEEYLKYESYAVLKIEDGLQIIAL